jgi:hypothetical protein
LIVITMAQEALCFERSMATWAMNRQWGQHDVAFVAF